VEKVDVKLAMWLDGGVNTERPRLEFGQDPRVANIADKRGKFKIVSISDMELIPLVFGLGHLGQSLEEDMWVMTENELVGTILGSQGHLIDNMMMKSIREERRANRLGACDYEMAIGRGYARWREQKEKYMFVKPGSKAARAKQKGWVGGDYFSADQVEKVWFGPESERFEMRVVEAHKVLVAEMLDPYSSTVMIETDPFRNLVTEQLVLCQVTFNRVKVQVNMVVDYLAVNPDGVSTVVDVKFGRDLDLSDEITKVQAFMYMAGVREMLTQARKARTRYRVHPALRDESVHKMYGIEYQNQLGHDEMRPVQVHWTDLTTKGVEMYYRQLTPEGFVYREIRFPSKFEENDVRKWMENRLDRIDEVYQTLRLLRERRNKAMVWPYIPKGDTENVIVQGRLF